MSINKPNTNDILFVIVVIALFCLVVKFLGCGPVEEDAPNPNPMNPALTTERPTKEDLYEGPKLSKEKEALQGTWLWKRNRYFFEIIFKDDLFSLSYNADGRTDAGDKENPKFYPYDAFDNELDLYGLLPDDQSLFTYTFIANETIKLNGRFLIEKRFLPDMELEKQ